MKNYIIAMLTFFSINSFGLETCKTIIDSDAPVKNHQMKTLIEKGYNPYSSLEEVKSGTNLRIGFESSGDGFTHSVGAWLSKVNRLEMQGDGTYFYVPEPRAIMTLDETYWGPLITGNRAKRDFNKFLKTLPSCADLK